MDTYKLPFDQQYDTFVAAFEGVQLSYVFAIQFEDEDPTFLALELGSHEQNRQNVQTLMEQLIAAHERETHPELFVIQPEDKSALAFGRSRGTNFRSLVAADQYIEEVGSLLTILGVCVDYTRFAVDSSKAFYREFYC